MLNNEITHPVECKCIAWRPIFAGALVALGLSFLLNLFSVAIGLTAYTTNSEGIEKLAFGGLIATAIGVVASMFVSGWLSGYLGTRHCNKRHLGTLYGFLTWCISLLLAAFLMTHMQEYVSSYTRFLSGSYQMLQVTAAKSNVVQSPTDSVVVSTYILFGLFFLSAFASSIGGHCGMRYRCKNERISEKL